MCDNTLIHETRGGMLDIIQRGHIAVVHEDGRLLASVGDPNSWVYYRSASKGLQALPFMVMELDKKYGFTEEECVLLTASHAGEPYHLAGILRMLEKTGFTESDLIMEPEYPGYPPERDRYIREGLPPRKALHNCSGKHISLMTLARELGDDPADYWKENNAAQKEILRVLSLMTEVPVADIRIGVDGCGVPVYAVPLTAMARSLQRMAAPDLCPDPSIRTAIRRLTPMINRRPAYVRGTDYPCTLMNSDPNIVAKGGANGTYCFGLKKERIGVALKTGDGMEKYWPIILKEILTQLDYDGQETLARLESIAHREITNCCRQVVGEAHAVFRFDRHS